MILLTLLIISAIIRISIIGSPSTNKCKCKNFAIVFKNFSLALPRALSDTPPQPNYLKYNVATRNQERDIPLEVTKLLFN